MTNEEARDKLDVVSGTFTLYSLLVCVIFDSGAMLTFVSSQFAKKLNISIVSLNESIIVEMYDGSLILVKDQYLDCRFEINENIYPIILKSITTNEFEVVVGMDWLATNKVQIICDEKLLVIEPLSGSKINIRGER